MKRLLLATLLIALAASPALADTPVEELCPPDQLDADKYRYLRSLSLDLRGVVPTMEEYAALDALDAVPESTIDEWLASPEFTARAVRFHRDLLWNNIRNVNLFNNQVGVRRTRMTDGSYLYWRTNPALRYRGDRVVCLDEPATFDDYGVPETTLQEDGTELEGYTWMAPYWAPGTQIKVCAFDAQDQMVSATGTECSSRDGINDVGCGCGPNMNWCRYGPVRNDIMDSFAAALDKRVAENVSEDGSYLDLFSDNRTWVNGPLVHYWRWMTEMYANVRLTPEPVHVADLPDIPYLEKDTWVQVELPESHSGILTDPAFLMRFQTRRGRANRFQNNFLCAPFNAPSGGLPNEGDAVPSLDLQVRDGCKYCHAMLEPVSSHWGRWAENGAGFLSAEDYPPLRDDCLDCAYYGGCSADCNRYYKTNALGSEEEPFLGMLDAYQFRRDPHKPNVEMGPKALVNESVVTGQLTECTAENAASFLLGREVLAEERPWIRELGVDFADSNYSWRSVVKSVLTSDTYRRVR